MHVEQQNEAKKGKLSNLSQEEMSEMLREQPRDDGKKYYKSKKDDPEFQAKRRKYAIKYYHSKKNDPEFQAERRKHAIKYYNSKKNDLEFRAKNQERAMKYLQNKKNDPNSRAAYLEKHSACQKKYRAKKKLEKQNHSLNNSTNENLNLDQSNQPCSSFLTTNSNQTHSTHLEFLMTDNIAENQNNINYIDNTYHINEKEIDALLDEINNYPDALLDEINNYPLQVGNKDNTYITPQNISNNINLNNANNITKHPKPLILYDSDDDQNNFSELFSL